MKRTIICFFLILFAFFYGCTENSEPKDAFSVPIKVEAMLDGSNSQFTADIFEGGCDIHFEEGHTLSGTVLKFRSEGNTATVGDTLTREVKKGTFPAQEALIKAVRLLSNTEAKGISDGQTTRYTIDEMTIIVYYNKNTDSINRIETEESGRRFGFSIASLEPYEAQSNSDYTS